MDLTKCDYFNDTFTYEYETGDVVCIDVEHSGKPEEYDLVKFITDCDSSYDKRVLSSINYDSTLTLRGFLYPVTMTRNIPVKVICDTPIEVGDPLVTSNVPGYAMSAYVDEPDNFRESFDMQSAVFVKALDSCDNGTATIRAWK
ncbi:MAG: hypothetical protein KJI70_03305 [Patescibacteria group bacterium]|nr:hypothetical protein [Patescibacteria group bacterium]